MASSLDALLRLAPRLRTQFGAVSISQAEGDGVSRQQIARLVEGGILVRRGHGLVASQLHDDRWEQRAMVLMLSCGPRAALSHGGAARLLSLEQTRVGRHPRLEVIVPRKARRVVPPGVRLHESIHFDPELDTALVGPLRVTSAAWTAASLAARTDLGHAERIIDATIANGQASISDFQQLVERWWHTPGVRALRAILLRHTPATALTDSEAERLFLRIVRDFNLPMPTPQVKVVDAAGRTRFLDFAYIEWRIAIEIDLHPSHLTTVGRRQDGSRQNDLVPEWLPLRFDAHDLAHRPRAVADQVRRALIAVGALAA